MHLSLFPVLEVYQGIKSMLIKKNDCCKSSTMDTCLIRIILKLYFSPSLCGGSIMMVRDSGIG